MIRVMREARVARVMRVARVVRVAGMMRVARVVRVARMMRVARVIRVARVVGVANKTQMYLSTRSRNEIKRIPTIELVNKEQGGGRLFHVQIILNEKLHYKCTTNMHLSMKQFAFVKTNTFL